jgi:hypothetical protein
MSAAERELGYRAVTTYEDSLPETIAWTLDALRERDWREVFPRMATLYSSIFDDAAEDRITPLLVTHSANSSAALATWG